MSEIKKVQINKRLKGLPRAELEKLSKNQLLDKIEQLQAYNFQLRNLLQKKLNDTEKNDDCYKSVLVPDTSIDTATKITKDAAQGKSPKRAFNFSKAHKRHVLLKLLYFGWDYQGYACQEDSHDTIESHLFKALIRTCLIESRATSNYHRCGRTDKEVSAYCQVISIDLRSKYPDEEQLNDKALANEIDYCGLLNRVLPKNIQCIAWMPLRNRSYSARFDCIARTYRYFFPRGDLNIKAMNEACQMLICHTDFRNFCKMDVHNGVTNYIRRIDKASVQECTSQSDNTGYCMHYLEIQANAFLWHQIRCIMAVLLLIGQEKEDPSIISELLDVSKNPCKPQYMPAIGMPLNLFDCQFRNLSSMRVRTTSHKNEVKDSIGFNRNDDDGDGIDDKEIVPCDIEETIMDGNEILSDTTKWIYIKENLQKVIENVQSEWTQFSIKCTMIRNVLEDLTATLHREFSIADSINTQILLLQDCIRPRQYQRLLDRKRCESLENRIDHYVKKQRIVLREE